MLETEIAGVKFRNPIFLASGTIGTEYTGLIDWRDYGAVVAKSVTLSARIGNPPPRVCETPSGMLNAIGLENKGVNYFIGTDLPAYLEAGATVIASIAGETVEGGQTNFVLTNAAGNRIEATLVFAKPK